MILVAFLITGGLSAFSQDGFPLKGVIVSQSNDPVSNVSVSVEGSTMMPVVSNVSGEFELEAPSGNEWLIISPTGEFKKKRVYLNNRDNVKIYLTPVNISGGDDQVTMLFQQFRKRNIITPYSELDVTDIHHTPALSVDEYMQGRVSGMNVINRSGMPGSGAVMNIRGVNSFNTNTQPLFIVDGVPLTSHGIFGSNLEGYAYNPLIAINPQDISKTMIIKDATLSSVYGSKGSNGVVFIETLDPSVTQTTIELDLRTGYSLAPPRYFPQLSAVQHKTLMNEILFSSGMLEENIRETYPSLYLTKDDERYIDYQHNTNWQDLIFHDALFTNLNLKVKGGDEIARYGLSFGVTNNNGIIKQTSFQGYNLRFVSRLNIFTWLKMNAGVSLNYNSSSLKEAATVEQTSPILTSLAKSPMLNPYQYDVNGNEISTLAEVDDIGISNPLAVIENYVAKHNNYNFITNLGLEGTINKDLSINSNFSLTYNVLKEILFMPNRGMELYYDDEAYNVSKATNNDLNSLYNNTYILFRKDIGNNHSITSNTGVHIQSNKYEYDWGLTKNSQENDEYRSIQDGLNNLREIGGANRNWNWISFYEYLTYAYRDKYLISGSVSLDGSSRVGEQAVNTMNLMGEPFGLFYSAGIAWRISNEFFLKNYAWLEDLKIRLTYGKSGNDDIGESSATNYYKAIKFRETVGLYPGIIPNYELSYEIITQVNAGLDLSLLGNRITASANLFKSTTDNMLILSPLESYLGYDWRIENGGSMENSGWEMNTFLRMIDGNRFKWDIYANVSSVRNEITEIDGDQLITEIPGGEVINKVGESANSFYGFIFKGVYASSEEAAEANLYNDKAIRYRAGDAIYADLSGPDGEPDGVIDDYDKTIIGSSMPDLFGGLTTAFTYKRWRLLTSVYFAVGQEVFNYVRYKNEQMTGLENQSATVLNRWQYQGQETDIPRALWNDPLGNSSFSTRWIEDGSFLRIKNITLSYKVPNEFLAFKNAEIYVSANNLFVFSDYLGYDPEFAYSYSPYNQGVDYGLTSQKRQFIAGIKVGF